MKIKLKQPEPTNPADIFSDIKKHYLEYKKTIVQLEQLGYDAFRKMFEFGKILLDNQDIIMNIYDTWAGFSMHEGLDKYAVSRCKSSVEDFIDLGATTADEAIKLVLSKNRKPTVKLMEGNIKKELSEPSPTKTPPKDNSITKERAINEIRKYADRINELVADHDIDDDIFQEAAHLTEFANESVSYIEKLDISQKEWNSQHYLDFVRNINYDVVLGKPVKKTEPHHISPKGDHGSQGAKVADCFAIPVTRETHNKLHHGKIKLSYEEISDMHRWTMAQFIMYMLSTDVTTETIKNIE